MYSYIAGYNSRSSSYYLLKTCVAIASMLSCASVVYVAMGSPHLAIKM